MSLTVGGSVVTGAILGNAGPPSSSSSVSPPVTGAIASANCSATVFTVSGDSSANPRPTPLGSKSAKVLAASGLISSNATSNGFVPASRSCTICSYKSISVWLGSVGSPKTLSMSSLSSLGISGAFNFSKVSSSIVADTLGSATLISSICSFNVVPLSVIFRVISSASSKVVILAALSDVTTGELGNPISSSVKPNSVKFCCNVLSVSLNPGAPVISPKSTVVGSSGGVTVGVTNGASSLPVNPASIIC